MNQSELIGYKLKQHRMKLGWTQEQMADKLNVRQNTRRMEFMISIQSWKLTIGLESTYFQKIRKNSHLTISY